MTPLRRRHEPSAPTLRDQRETDPAGAGVSACGAAGCTLGCGGFGGGLTAVC